MTARVDWAEYHRRLAVREQRRAQVETEVGYTGAPIRLWQFDAHSGEADSGGQRVATSGRNLVRGRR